MKENVPANILMKDRQILKKTYAIVKKSLPEITVYNIVKH